jgi:N-formylglutamate amidohydrolase
MDSLLQNLPSGLEQAAAPGPGDARPYLIHAPAEQAMPVVFSSAHSGRAYTQEFVAAAQLDELTLRRSEDSYVDEIFAAAPSLGAPLLAACFPRAFCDVNREAWELDPAMFEDALPPWVNTTSPRASAGFGTIPRVVANGEAIYGIRLRFAEAERRVKSYWRPYHAALAALVEATRARFGVCVLVDCHSMPASATAALAPPPDVVLGDAYGAACFPELVRRAEAFFSARGYLTRRNDPYAGGYVTRHYGRPRRGVHALQIEFARRLYMNEATMEKSAGFSRLENDAAALMPILAEIARAL